MSHCVAADAVTPTIVFPFCVCFFENKKTAEITEDAENHPQRAS